MNKTFIYNLLCYDDFSENIVNKIHQECLKYIIMGNIFDRYMIIVSADPQREDIKNSALEWINNVNAENENVNIEIFFEQIDEFGATKVYKKYAIDNIDHYDGAILWGSNFSTNEYLNVFTVNESVFQTICAAYYYTNIDFIENVFDNGKMFYGPFLTCISDKSKVLRRDMPENINNVVYQCGMYWINADILKDYIKDKFYMYDPSNPLITEEFPSMVCGPDVFEFVSSPNNFLMNDEWNLYVMDENTWRELYYRMGNEETAINFYNKIKNNVGI